MESLSSLLDTWLGERVTDEALDEHKVRVGAPCAVDTYRVDRPAVVITHVRAMFFGRGASEQARGEREVFYSL